MPKTCFRVRRQALVAIMLCFLMSGCEEVGSIQPLYDQETIVTESNLVGTWDFFDGGHLFATITIEQDREKTYRGTITRPWNDRTIRFTLVLVRLDEGLYADASFEPVEAVKDQESDPPPPHNFYRVKLSQHTLELWALSEFPFKHLLNENKFKIAHKTRKQGFLLTAPTEEIQSLVIRHGSELFSDSFSLDLYRRETDSRLATLKEKLLANPADPESNRILGELYMERGRYEDASVAFQQALRLDPSSSVYRDHLWEAYLALRKYEDARTVYRSSQGHPRVGEVYYLEGRYKEAAQELERFGDSYTVIWHSLALEHLGQAAKAYELRSQFHSGDKEQGEHGWAYDPSDYLNGRTTEEEFLERAEESGQYCLALVIIAEQQFLRGEPWKAKETLAKAVATKRYGDFGYIAAKALLAR